MSVVVVGLEHHRAPLDVLERATVSDAELPKTLAALRDRSNLLEVVVLSTCLRTELYAVVERFHEGVTDLQEHLAASVETTVEQLAEQLTVQFDDAVAVHLFEVAAGLRSAIPGEHEVLGQVRLAGERAAGRARLGACALEPLRPGGPSRAPGALRDVDRSGRPLARALCRSISSSTVWPEGSVPPRWSWSAPAR